MLTIILILLLGIHSYYAYNAALLDLNSSNALSGEKFSDVVDRCGFMDSYLKQHSSFVSAFRIVHIQAFPPFESFMLNFHIHMRFAIRYNFALFVNTSSYPMLNTVLSPVFVNFTMSNDLKVKSLDSSIVKFDTHYRGGEVWMYNSSETSNIHDTIEILSSRLKTDLYDYVPSNCMLNMFFQQSDFMHNDMVNLLHNKFNNPMNMVVWHMHIVNPTLATRKPNYFLSWNDDLDHICDQYYGAHLLSGSDHNNIYLAVADAPLLERRCKAKFPHLDFFYLDKYNRYDFYENLFMMLNGVNVIHTGGMATAAVVSLRNMECKITEYSIRQNNVIYCFIPEKNVNGVEPTEGKSNPNSSSGGSSSVLVVVIIFVVCLVVLYYTRISKNR